jgi:hypothetical protein
VHSWVWEEGRFGAWRALGPATAWANQVQRGLVSLQWVGAEMSSRLSCGCIISTSCVSGRPLPSECAARQRVPLHPSKLSPRVRIEPAQLQTHPWCRRPQMGTQRLLLQVPTLRPQSWWRWSPFRPSVQRWVRTSPFQHPVVSNVAGPLPASLLSSRPSRIVTPTPPPPRAPPHTQRNRSLRMRSTA